MKTDWIKNIFTFQEDWRVASVFAYGIVVPAVLYWCVYRPIKWIVAQFFFQEKKEIADNSKPLPSVDPKLTMELGDEAKRSSSYQALHQPLTQTQSTSLSRSGVSSSFPGASNYTYTPFAAFRKDTSDLNGAQIFPWAYEDVTDFSSGVIISVDPDAKKARFTKDPRIQELKEEHGIKEIYFRLSDEAKITLKKEKKGTEEKEICPTGSTAFQYLSQGIFEFNDM